MKRYTVITTTTREKDGQPDLYWKSIGVKKLERVVRDSEHYAFRCIIGKEVFEYKCAAKKLQQNFRKEAVHIRGSRNESGDSFFVEKASGILSHIDESEHLICELARDVFRPDGMLMFADLDDLVSMKKSEN